jgi:hypothetical protein
VGREETGTALATRVTASNRNQQAGDRKAPRGEAARLRPTGARESGAGDQFHHLWAARRAMCLLARTSGLERLRLEGFSPDEPVSSSSDLLLGADVVEYYGGGSFATATTIVISQLKYSHRHPEVAWTAARLCAPSRPNGPSVISRLGELYQAVRGAHTRREAIEKLRVTMVSNQPASPGLLAAIDAARRVLAAAKRPISTETLVGQLPTGAGSHIRRLAHGTSLETKAFPDFLRVLDLGGCGSESRSIQEAQLGIEVRKYLPDEVQAATDRIYRIVVAETMPEAVDSPGLTRANILAALGVDSESALFPVPSMSQRIVEPLNTPDLQRLAQAVEVSARLIAHGDAGVGKTTTLQSLENLLPAGSIVVRYDCFGGGSYLDPAEGRHLPERALLQLSNELATRCDTPELLKPPTVSAELWRAFRERLDRAGSALGGNGRLLVIAIDAADNAVFAAREAGDHCFVPRLWNLSLPDNVRLLITSRTHRVADLDAPIGTAEVVLTGFDLAASSIYLRRRFDADGPACTLFHERTSGNPRVQFYVLDEERAPTLTLGLALLDAERTPTHIFNDLLESATTHAPDPHRAHEILANLVCLARPARISTFAKATGIQVAEASRFAHGLSPGVFVGPDSIVFRDEDFEKHLRDAVGSAGEGAAHKRLADYFSTHDLTDGEAALVVAEHLFRAREYRRLVDFTLQRGEPGAIRDPVVRLHAYRRRLAFALRAASEEGARADALRLIVMAGDAARSGSAIEAVVRERPDLAMRHGEAMGVAEIYLRQDQAPFRGPIHLRISAMYARESDFDSAGDHFEFALVWFREARRRSKQGEDDDWRIGTGDIAAGAEAFYWRDGLKAAVRWLDGWKPPEAVFNAKLELGSSLAYRCPPGNLIKEVLATPLGTRARAAFLALIWRAGGAPPKKVVRTLAPLLERSLRASRIKFEGPAIGHPRDSGEWPLLFAELAASTGVDRAIVLGLLKRVAPSVPDDTPSEWTDMTAHDAWLRRVALEAVLEGRHLSVDDLLPKKLLPQANPERGGYDPKESERRTFREIFGEMLPAYLLRARCLTMRATVTEIEGAIRDQLTTRRTKASHRWAKFDRRYRLWANTVGDAALRAPGGDPAELIREIADVANQAVRTAAPDVWLDLAERAVSRPDHKPLALTLIDRAASFVEEDDRPARDRTERLLRCASLLDALDPVLAHDYYERAVTAASGIDDEAITLLELHARLAARLSIADQSVTGEMAHRMLSLLESFEAKVSDRDRLPHAETLRAVGTLHPPAAFAAASRWDDEDRWDLTSSVYPLVDAALKSDFIAPTDALWLMRLVGEHADISSRVLAILDKIRKKGRSGRPELATVLGHVASWVARDLSPDIRLTAARGIVAWADTTGNGGLAGVQELRRVVRYADSVQSPPPADQFSPIGVEHPTDGPRKNVAPPKRAADLPTRLTELLEQFPSVGDVTAYIVSAGRATNPSERVAFLDTLTNLPSDHRAVRWQAEAVVTGVGRLLHEWRNSGPVARWASARIPVFVEQHFIALVAYEQTARAALQALLTLPFAGDPGLALLQGLTSHIESLTPNQLFAVADALGSILPDEELLDVLQWSVTRLEGGADPGAAPDLPLGADETLAAFLFAVFGSFDKRKRWRAAHAARAMLGPGRQGLVDALMTKVSSETAGAFVAPRLPFYWLSARQWLFAVIARLADEQPATLRPHLPSLISIARDKDLPHAAIREMARRAAISVASAELAVDEGRLEELRSLNEPTACVVERRFRDDSSSRTTRKNERFHFDSMDTQPYWFWPLAKVFNSTTHEVAARVESWVVDRLGFSDDDAWTDRRELSREHDHNLMRNDHGSIPVLETLRTYLEYHGLLLAAGQMVDEGMPVAYDEWDEFPEPWREWLSSHVDAFPGFWLSDLRAAPPLEPFVCADLPPLEAWTAVSQGDFDQHVFVDREGDPWVTVHARMTRWARDRHANVVIRSALVAPTTAISLLRALRTTDPRNFLVPYEGQEETGEGRREIHSREFELSGLLVSINREGESLEQHDPLRRIRYSFERPGEAFATQMAATETSDGLRLIDSQGRVVSESALWDDGSHQEHERVEDGFADGDRTLVPLDVLLNFLRTKERDLVMEVQLDRYVDRRYETGKQEYEPPKSCIYLLRGNGILETLDRRRRVGKEDRSRPGPR